MKTQFFTALTALFFLQLGACVNIPQLDASTDTPTASDNPTNNADGADGDASSNTMSADADDAAPLDEGDAAITAMDAADAMDSSALDGRSMDVADATDVSMDSPTCMRGEARCGASCADLQSSAMHCGMCGNACPGAQVCESGECRCPGATVACGAACVDTGSDPNNCGRCGNACPAGIGCMGGVCSCPARGTVCSGMCVDTQSNSAHCGLCGNACPAGQVCTAGACGCAAPTNLCAGSCVNLQSSNNHCGACGNRCPAGTSCSSGSCVCPGMGATYCAGTMTCSVLANDPANCGVCGNSCPAAQSCVAGSCQCPGANPTLCGALCINTLTSNAHCGACNNACPAAQTCSNGACVCPALTPNLCGAACVNRMTDRNNCGACGNVCRGDQNCAGGVCQCPAGQSDCAGACVNTQNNNAHCGMCNRACGMTQTCSAGVCSCAAGLSPCGPNCVNLTNDRANCGACAMSCTASQICAASNCRCPVGTADCSGMGVCIDITSDTANCGRCGMSCPVVANSSPTCAASACGFQCSAGFADCDANAGNGCETNTNSSVNNCGGCGIQCATGMCVGGVCQEWARRIGGTTGNERGADVAVDGDGNLYFVGTFAGPMNVGAPMPLNCASTGGFVVSYTPTGTYRWSRVIDTAMGDDLTAVAATGRGVNARVVVAGRVAGAVDAGGGVIGIAGPQGVIAEYSGVSGGHLWSYVYRSDGGTLPNTDDLAFGPANEVYLTGGHYGSFQIQGNSVVGPNSSIGFLVKLDAAGLFQWGRAFGVNGYFAQGTGVAIDPFGDVYLTARVGSVIDVGGGARGTLNQADDVLVAKFTSSNMHVWSDVFGTNGSVQTPDSIVVDPITNDITIAGSFNAGLDFGAGQLPVFAPAPNVFLATFNSTGAAGRAVHLRSVSYATGVASGFGGHETLTFTPGGRLFLHTTYASGITSFGGQSVPGSFGQKTLVAEHNPANLSVLNAVGFNNAGGTAYAGSIVACGSNYVCFTGHFGPTITIGSTTLTNLGAGSDYDVYMARLLRP